MWAKVYAKSNEVPAIPALLALLALGSCIVTIDASGAQTEVARAIVDQGADYVPAVQVKQAQLAARAVS